MISFKVLDAGYKNEIANLHVASFPDFFLTSLGGNFLKSFYRAILFSKSGFGVGVFDGEVLLGFAIGTSQVNNFYLNIFKTNGINLIFSCFWKLFFNPIMGLKILRNLIGGGQNLKIEKGIWLLSICTDPEKWGSGISGLLLKEFENLASKKKCYEIYLSTDHDKNERVNSFYLKYNYIVIDTFFNGNKRKMNLYFKALNNK